MASNSLDDRDGMGGLYVELPSVSAHAIFNRLTEAAIGVDGPQDDRTLDQRRADVFVHVMLAEVDGEHFGIVPDEHDDENFVKWFRGIAAKVVISVPVLTLLGQRMTRPSSTVACRSIRAPRGCSPRARRPSSAS